MPVSAAGCARVVTAPGTHESLRTYRGLSILVTLSGELKVGRFLV